jgi:hypothetical protein
VNGSGKETKTCRHSKVKIRAAFKRGEQWSTRVLSLWIRPGVHSGEFCSRKRCPNDDFA